VSNGKIGLTQKESETEIENMLRELESHLDIPARIDNTGAMHSIRYGCHTSQEYTIPRHNIHY
jgi:hypothetical protein